MNYSKTFLLIMLIGCLTSCTTTEQTQKPITEAVAITKPVDTTSLTVENVDTEETPNLEVLCSSAYVEHLVLPPPPVTGIERQEPIVLMTRKAFNEKIKSSPLWDSLYDKELHYGSYGYSYYFETLIDLIGSSSYIRVYSELDGRKWTEDQRLTQFNYGIGSVYKRSKYKHQLLPQEKVEMIETINLVIEDRQKATEIVDTLYKQYMEKVNNQQYLSDGETIHTYIEYEGKFFSLWGVNITSNEVPVCNYEMLSGLTIN